MPHKFKVGQRVDYAPGRLILAATTQHYEIIRQLPPTDGQYQYRIKCKSETFERSAMESELSRRQ